MSLAGGKSEFPFVDLSKVEPRLYQQNLYRSALKDNTLLVLPTGLGKTVVALMLAGKTVEEASKAPLRKGACVVVLAPTKPLVLQHAAFFRDNLLGAGAPDGAGRRPKGTAVLVADMTGEVPPEAREALFLEADIVIATPQVVRNDLAALRVSLAGVRLLVFDEAHRAAGEYPYVSLAKSFREQAGANGRILGLTASPGGNARSILAVCEALGIQQIDVRTEEDKDVAPYVHEVRVNWIEVDLPSDLKVIEAKLRRSFDNEIRKLQDAGVLKRGRYASAKDLLASRGILQGQMDRTPYAQRGPLWGLVSAQAKAMKLNRAMEYLETQGREVFLGYLDRVRREATQKGGSGASRALAKDKDFMDAETLARKSTAEHPKLSTAVKLVERALRSNPNGRVILFAHFRETSEILFQRLSAVPGLRPAKITGQTTRGRDVGLTQKEQIQVIRDFDAGTFNVLVATSVAEEGLDIPQVDHVIFFEPVPSEIRSIQRRGRTGRRRAGSVEVLVARHTRDEAYMRAANAKESTMREELKKLRVNLRLPIEVLDVPGEGEVKLRLDPFPAGEPHREAGARGSLEAFDGPAAAAEPHAAPPPGPEPEGEGGREPEREGAPELLVDDRELKGPLFDELRSLGLRLVPERLDVGDFACPPRLGVERKTVKDFAASVADGRLFAQAEALSKAFERAVFLIEGGDAAGYEGLTPEAFHGAVAHLIDAFHIAVLRTEGTRQTAHALAALARRAAEGPARAPLASIPRGPKTGLSPPERQRVILQGLPGVSAVTAQRLLTHFGSIRALSQASFEEIAAVQGMNKRTAEQVFDILRAAYPADGG